LEFLSGISVTSITATAPITVSASTGAVNIAINNSTTTTVGAASFPSTYFSVSSGAVTPNNFTINTSAPLTGGGAITLGGTLSLAVSNATTSTVGVASFNSTNFSVTTGAVNTIQNINTGASPTFVGLNLSGLTASQAVVTDGSKNLASLQYTSSIVNSTLVSRDANGTTSANNFITPMRQIVAGGSTVVLTASSVRKQILIGPGSTTFQLPDATTLTVGTQFDFANDATGTLTIVKGNGGALTSIAAGGYATLFVTDISSIAGSWDYHFFIPSNASWGTAGLITPGQVKCATFQMTTSPTNGYVMTSDASGNGAWAAVTSIGAITTINGDTGSVTPSSGIVTINGGTTGLTTSGSSSTLSLTGTLNVGYGGTGAASFTAYAPIVGGTTSTGAYQSATTGFSSSGNVFVTNGSSALPSFVALSTIGVTTLTGTANEVLVNGTSGSATTGAITLTTPQAIGTASNVQFGSLKLNTSSAPTATTILTSSVSTARNANIVLSGNSMDNTTSTDGVAIMMSHNASTNRQLAIVDSTLTASSSSSTMVRILPNVPAIDAIATDGSTVKQLTVGNTGGVYMPGRVSIGSSSVITQLYVSANNASDFTTVYYSGTQTGPGTNNKVQALFIDTILNPNFAGTISADLVSSVYVYPQINPQSGCTISQAAALYLAGVAPGGAGSITTGYGIKVGCAIGATNSYAGYFLAPSGTSTNKTALYADNAAIGYTGVTPPSSGLLVSGSTGIGTSSVSTKFHVFDSSSVAAGEVGSILLSGTLTSGPGLPRLCHGINYDSTQMYYGYIQSVETGRAARALLLQNIGGSTGIGTGYSATVLPAATCDIWGDYFNPNATLKVTGPSSQINTWATPVAGIALNSVTNTVSQSSDTETGYTFTSSSTVYVTALGYVDNSSTFSSGSRSVGLYNNSGTLLASVSVSSGATTVNNFKYANLASSVRLPAGTYTILAISPAFNNWLSNCSTTMAAPFSFSSWVTKATTSALTYYTANDYAATTALGPGFLYTTPQSTILANSDGSVTLGGTTAITSTLGLPNSIGSYLYMAGGFGSPTLGRIYVGDGTGWQLLMSKRTGSANTDLFYFSDQGWLGINKTPAQALDISGSILTQSGGGATYAARFRDSSGNNGIDISAAAVYSQSDVFSARDLTLGAWVSSAHVNVMSLTSTKSVLLSLAALATNATDGFTYIPTCAGTPTGTPTAQTGVKPIVYDTTNNKIWVYNGSWRGVVVT
jgi:hypothetical protein